MKTLYYIWVIALSLGLSFCGNASDEEPAPTPAPSPSALTIRFVYDYNMKWANTIEEQEMSANVWAFNQEGKLAWSGEATADQFAKSGYSINVDLPAGKYDIVAWCGLQGNEGVALSTYKPNSKEDLSVTLKTNKTNGLEVADQPIKPLYHTSALDVEIKDGEIASNTVTMSLMGDIKQFRVGLQDKDNHSIDMKRFNVSITAETGTFGWDNAYI